MGTTYLQENIRLFAKSSIKYFLTCPMSSHLFKSANNSNHNHPHPKKQQG